MWTLDTDLEIEFILTAQQKEDVREDKGEDDVVDVIGSSDIIQTSDDHEASSDKEKERDKPKVPEKSNAEKTKVTNIINHRFINRLIVQLLKKNHRHLFMNVYLFRHL